MRTVKTPGRFALSCTLASIASLSSAYAAVTPGGNLGDHAIIIESTGGEQLLAATAPDGFGPILVQDFDTSVQIDGTYEFNPSGIDATQIALSAGRHLVMYDSRFDVPTGTTRSEFMANLTLNGTALAIGRSHCNVRRSGGADEGVLSGGGIITVTSDDDILTLETQRSDDNATATILPTRVPNGTAIQFLKLDDSWDFLSLQQSVDQASTIPAVFTDVTYDTNNSPGTMGSAFSFTDNTGDITINESGLYLVFANTRLEKTNNVTRTSYQQRLTLDGAEVNGSKTTTYLRGDANGEAANSGVAAIGTLVQALSGQTLNVEVALEAGGTASTIQGNETALTIVKLPGTAKSISLNHSVSQEVNTPTTTPLIFDTSASAANSVFSHSPGTSPVTVNGNDDYLFFGSIFTSSSAVSEDHLRTLPLQGWQIDGTGGPIARGRSAGYNRDSGNGRTGGDWGGVIVSLNAGQTIEMTSEQLGTDRLGITSSVALQGLSISSLIPSNDPAIALNLPLEIEPGDNALINGDLLNTVDGNTPDNNLVYTLTSAPTGGTLSHTINGTVNNGDSFTQDDLNNDRLSFAADPAPTTGGFDFTVSDGAASDSSAFVINVKYPDATVSIVSNGDISEGETASWTLTSSLPASGSNLVIDITYSGSASDGTDFTGSASVEIPAGSSSADLEFATLADGAYEGCETIIASISGISGGQLTASSGSPSDAILLVADGGNSNPVLNTQSRTIVGTGIIPLTGLSALDPDTGYESTISTTTAPLFYFNGQSNTSIFSDFRTQDDSSFDLDASGPALNYGAGFSLELDFSINSADLTGSIVVWDIGGSSNGTALLLVEGIPHLLVKSGGAPTDQPTDDNALDNVFQDLDWDLDDTVVVPLSSSPLTPGLPARIALILSDANDSVQFSVNGATATTVNLLNNDSNNWAGDHTVNLGRGAGTGIGGNTNVIDTPFTDLDLINLSGGPEAIVCAKFWNESTGSLAITDSATLDEITVTLTIDNWTFGNGDFTATSGNGETYADGVWSITSDQNSVNAALAAVEFVTGFASVDPTTITVSLEDGNEDGNGPLTDRLVIVGSDFQFIYVDDDFAGSPIGTDIPDADSGTPVAPAIIGFNAFPSITEALAESTPTGTVIVNDGDYSSEIVALQDSTILKLTGNGASTVTISSLSTGSITATLDLGSETLVTGSTTTTSFDGSVIGSGHLTKVGTGRFILRNLMSYSGTTTIDDGFLRLGYEAGKAIYGNWDGDGPIVVNSPGTLEFNCGLGYTQEQTGVISGDGDVLKIDNGTLIFDGPSGNTFSGRFGMGDGASSTFDGVDLGAQEGIVIVNHNDHLGTGLVHSRGAQLQAGSPGVTIPNTIEIDAGGFRCGGIIDFTLSGDLFPINNSTRGFGNYGLNELDLTITGDIDTTGGAINFEGSNGKDNGTWTVAGNISGPSVVTLQGSIGNGSVTFSGANTYTANTALNGNSILYLNGTHTGGGVYNVNATSTLAGTGSTESAINLTGSAFLSPGVDSIATLGTGPLTLNGTLAIDVDNTAGAAGTDWDQLIVTGTVDVSNGALSVAQSETVEVNPATIVVIANDLADATTGPFLSGTPFTNDYLSSGLAGDADYAAGDGNDVALVTATPDIIGAWRFAYFGSSQNTGEGANSSDAADSDGLINLLEFSFGTDPTIADNTPLALDGSVNGIPLVEVTSLESQAYFVRRDDHGSPGSITYTPQFSADLATWHDSANTTIVVADSTDDPDYEIVKIAYPLFLPDGEPRYFRVKVTLNE